MELWKPELWFPGRPRRQRWQPPTPHMAGVNHHKCCCSGPCTCACPNPYWCQYCSGSEYGEPNCTPSAFRVSISNTVIQFDPDTCVNLQRADFGNPPNTIFWRSQKLTSLSAANGSYTLPGSGCYWWLYPPDPDPQLWFPVWNGVDCTGDESAGFYWNWKYELERTSTGWTFSVYCNLQDFGEIGYFFRGTLADTDRGCCKTMRIDNALTAGGYSELIVNWEGGTQGHEFHLASGGYADFTPCES